MDPLDDMRYDAADLTDRIIAVLDRVGVSLSLRRAQLAATIHQYAEARRWNGPYDVSVRQPADILIPSGWTAHDESVWVSWLNDTVSDEVWQQCVTDPVFGTDVRTWERNGTAWRHELLTYMPLWAARSFAIVERHDPLPLPEEVVAEQQMMEETSEQRVGGRRRR